MSIKLFSPVSQAPTKPQSTPGPTQFDVADLYQGPPPSFELGDQHCSITLPSGQSYSSFVLLLLLNFAYAENACLSVGRAAARPRVRC
jgi:hypothetical protein